MEFIKTLWKNKKIVLKLGKNDFKNRFASTSLGSMWGFLQPFIFMMMYVVVFQFIFKTTGEGNSPYVVWFLPGMAMWMCLNDNIMGASGAIRSYAYLVKKVVFPVDVIPMITITGNSIVSIFLFFIAAVVCMIFGYMPNILEFVYVIFAAYAFIIALTRFTSAITTLVPDFSNLLSIAMQLFFWATPVVWGLTMIAEHQTILKVMQCLPFTYLVTAFREVFMGGNIITKGHGIYTIIFWSLTIIIFLWGNHVFKKNKKDFADVI
ncbi:MAG: ABC transporter permease [Clostridia bacterium]|nr:ABC transporter permease [Clostridia bacterium]